MSLNICVAVCGFAANVFKSGMAVRSNVVNQMTMIEEKKKTVSTTTRNDDEKLVSVGTNTHLSSAQ